MDRKAYGFTIVELLIVIVVIGILAAISIVAYNGISNNAHDSTVKNDITNMAKKIQLDHAERGSYLLGGSATGSNTLFPGFTFKPSKGSYWTDSSNLVYCTGSSGGQPAFSILARSKSGNTYQYSTASGLQELGQVAINSTSGCSGFSSVSRTYGYYQTTNTWWSWTNG